MRDILVVTAQTLLLAMLAPAVVGYVRLAKARLQGRRHDRHRTDLLSSLDR